MDLRWDLILPRLPYILEGAVMTVKLTAISVGLGLIFGTFLGIGRLAKPWPIRALASAYVTFFRGTPLLVQIFLVYFGLPQFVGPLPREFAGILALSLNSAAYVAEIVRAGIQSIDRGQLEAGWSTGLSHAQTLRYIVLPQAFRRIVPPLGNEFIALLKDSSLVAVISLEELLRRGQLVATRNFRFFEVYILVAIIYLILTVGISQLVNLAERWLDVGRKRGRQRVPAPSTSS
ncbi:MULTISPECIES: amino acid ABC transporter permease [Limnochorda]|uniref:amino acid ABC transporter permease n=1 Tax=Limnochorda TaxID=1676651 RepID=UPI0017940BA7|nr:amino acid ABC transporter permease [Limnochorda pilosa]MBO2487198.1 nickel transporter [Bacillota bacterium]MBO2519402.1 nickel transporter [Bacillota bacterium]NMA71955.1 amino acid ABC transporter permease [Bacillota bacterium]